MLCHDLCENKGISWVFSVLAFVEWFWRRYRLSSEMVGKLVRFVLGRLVQVIFFQINTRLGLLHCDITRAVSSASGLVSQFRSTGLTSIGRAQAWACMVKPEFFRHFGSNKEAKIRRQWKKLLQLHFDTWIMTCRRPGSKVWKKSIPVKARVTKNHMLCVTFNARKHNWLRVQQQFKNALHAF